MKEFPQKATWKNKDFDLEVIVVGVYGEHEGTVYYKLSTSTGVPENELIFENISLWKKIRNLFI